MKTLTIFGFVIGSMLMASCSKETFMPRPVFDQTVMTLQSTAPCTTVKWTYYNIDGTFRVENTMFIDSVDFNQRISMTATTEDISDFKVFKDNSVVQTVHESKVIEYYHAGSR